MPKMSCLAANYFMPRLSVLLIFPLTVMAEQTPSRAETKEKHAKIYRTPEERRDAGRSTPLTDWLKFSGLLEIDNEYTQSRFADHASNTDDNATSSTLELGFNITAKEWFEIELIFEADKQKHFDIQLDEGLISTEIDDWGLQIGRQHVPFGEFYSNFVTGPMLEFGETRQTSFIIDYSFNDTLEIAGFLFSSQLETQDESQPYDWGLRFEIASEDEAWVLGISYLSDLAETKEPLLEKNTQTYQQRVAGWNVYALIVINDLALTAEMLGATHPFAELPANENKPVAYNLELAYFLNNTLQFAMRIAHSKELADQPRWQYGAAISWRFANRFSASMDYLYGKYKSGFVFDDNDHELTHSHQIAAQLAFEF